METSSIWTNNNGNTRDNNIHSHIGIKVTIATLITKKLGFFFIPLKMSIC